MFRFGFDLDAGQEQSVSSGDAVAVVAEASAPAAPVVPVEQVEPDWGEVARTAAELRFSPAARALTIGKRAYRIVDPSAKDTGLRATTHARWGPIPLVPPHVATVCPCTMPQPRDAAPSDTPDHHSQVHSRILSARQTSSLVSPLLSRRQNVLDLVRKLAHSEQQVRCVALHAASQACTRAASSSGSVLWISGGRRHTRHDRTTAAPPHCGCRNHVRARTQCCTRAHPVALVC